MKLKPVHYFFKNESVLPSLKNDCHPGLAHFGNEQFPARDDNKEEKNVIKCLDSFSFDAVHPENVSFKKRSMKNAKTLIQQFFLMVILRIRSGVEKHKKKFPTELICL